jgi:hypothetical protein
MLLVAAAMVVASMLIPATANATALGTITPSIIPVGGSATVTGSCSGSPFNETVRVVLLGSGKIVYVTGVSAPVGDFSGTFTVPSDQPVGPETAQVQCWNTSSSDGTSIGDLPITITGAIATVVAGTVTCNVAAGQETYTLHWSVITGTSAADITGATQSGILTDPVTFTPSSISSGSTATSADVTIPNQVGSVTITVAYSVGGTAHTPITGEIDLSGTCVLPASSAQVVPTFTG